MKYSTIIKLSFSFLGDNEILGYDTGTLDDYVPTANINEITNLNVHSKNISDLTGIEAFVALTSLNCYNNQIIEISVRLKSPFQAWWLYVARRSCADLCDLVNL